MRHLTIISVALLLFHCNSKLSETSQNADSVARDQSAGIEMSASTENESAADTSASTNETSTGACACDVRAYLADPDDSGTNIRETPKGKVIGQLKYDADCQCLTVSFVESKDGWMKLEEGGWVLGKLFAVDTRNYGPGQKVYLQESPTEESAVVAEFDTEKNFTVKGCCGSWLEVIDSSGTTGWLSGEMICANPLTNCS